jgi:hypothetical protein
MRRVVEAGGKCGFIERGGDDRVAAEPRQERVGGARRRALPHRHGVPLHQQIGVLARDALLRQREKHALRIVQAAEKREVPRHVLGIDDQALDEIGQPMQREIEVDRRVGRNAALHG